MNEQIRAAQVRLIGPEGEQVGVLSLRDALEYALERDLDLVEVAPEAAPPVCKVLDYAKFKYQASVKAKEARKHQARVIVKEMKLRPKIDPHDYETKKGHVVRFLKAGDKVKVTIMFRGREQSRPELGVRLIERLAADLASYGVMETRAVHEGRNMTAVFAPHRAPEAPEQAGPPPAPTGAPSDPEDGPRPPAEAAAG